MANFPLDEHGILLRRRAVELGYDDNWLWRMVAGGVLVRMRQGAYVDAAIWRAATRAEKHVLKSRAVMQQYDDRVALSHASAHVRAGGPDWGLDLSSVNVTNLHGRGDRTKAGVTHHHGECRVGDVSRLEEHWITAPGRTAVDTAAAVRLVPAVCVLDWWLNQGLTTRDELQRYVHEYMRHWPMTVGLPAAFARSDGRSQSIGEARTRLILEDGGYHPEPQFSVAHPSGRVAGIVDFVLREHGILIEFDGKIKYGRLLKPGQTLADVIMAERARETLLQELTGMWVIRFTWADLDNPAEMLRRIAEVIAKKARLRAV